MSFLQTVNQLSYKKILSIAVFLAVLFAVPVVLFLINRETRLSSRATFEKPEIVQEPKATPGPIPLEPPLVGRAFPWVGKEGDIIWVQGWNFGVNPSNKSLVIGGVEVRDVDIAAWEDDLIQAIIPDGARQGGTVEVRVGNYPVSRSVPIVLYDQNVQVRLHKQDNIVSANSAGQVVRAVIWTGDDEIPTAQHTQDVLPDQNGNAVIFDTTGLPILSIVLIDSAGNIVPYAADPIEFDF